MIGWTDWEIETYKINTIYHVLLPIQGARHAYTSIVGRNQANPTAILLCAANMLHHMNLQYHSDLIRDAVHKTIELGKVSQFVCSVSVCGCDYGPARKWWTRNWKLLILTKQICLNFSSQRNGKSVCFQVVEGCLLCALKCIIGLG